MAGGCAISQQRKLGSELNTRVHKSFSWMLRKSLCVTQENSETRVSRDPIIRSRKDFAFCYRGFFAGGWREIQQIRILNLPHPSEGVILVISSKLTNADSTHYPRLLSSFTRIKLPTNNVQRTFCPFPVSLPTSDIRVLQHNWEQREILSPIEREKWEILSFCP